MASNITNMTEGSPRKHIIKFIIPLIIGNVFQQLYNWVDTIIVGRYVGIKALAGVGACGNRSSRLTINGTSDMMNLSECIRTLAISYIYIRQLLPQISHCTAGTADTGIEPVPAGSGHE